MKNDDAYNDWEYEKRRAIEFFQKFDKTLLEVREQIEKRNEELDNLFLNIDKEKGKSIDDVFIDNLIDYGSKQTNKTLLTSLDEAYKRAKQQEETFSKLPSDQQKIIQKRLAELEQLVDRGQRMKDAGYTPEYTDKVMRLTYDMCKDGLREVAAEIDLAGLEKPNLFPKDFVVVRDGRVDKGEVIKELGWFNSSNYDDKKPVFLDGKEFRSLTEYIASKTTPTVFNAIEEANKIQGRSSYFEIPCYRKYAVLKSMGYDFADYQDWSEAKKTLKSAGFFVDHRSGIMQRVFDQLKNRPDDLNKYTEGQATFDAAIQVVLENIKSIGIDSKSRSMILLRTEDSAVVPDLKGENINGEKTARNKTYFPGVCESHGHIVASNINSAFAPEPKTLTAVRVPFSRVHSLWFMERGKIESNGSYTKDFVSDSDDGNFQFWAYHQNEIDACTQGLPIINVGDISKITNSREESETALKNWENQNGQN